jgi:hypothetical protein
LGKDRRRRRGRRAATPRLQRASWSGKYAEQNYTSCQADSNRFRGQGGLIGEVLLIEGDAIDLMGRPPLGRRPSTAAAAAGGSRGAPFRIGFAQGGVHGSRGQRSRRCVGGPDLSLPGREQTPLDPSRRPRRARAPARGRPARKPQKLAAGKLCRNQDKNRAGRAGPPAVKSQGSREVLCRRQRVSIRKVGWRVYGVGKVCVCLL